MGLDISYYQNAKRVSDIPDDDEELDAVYEAEKVVIHGNGCAKFDSRMDGMTPGIYDAEHVDCFRAGSYSGYNLWRRLLCEAIHGVRPEVVWNAEESEYPAFTELINFPDNEGVIGPKTSAKLAADFTKHGASLKAQFGTATEEARWWCELYDTWGEAFATAAQGGFVEFH